MLEPRYREGFTHALMGVLFALGALSCGLVVSTDDYDASEGAAARFAVSGTVDGLVGKNATLVVNGTSPLVVQDGRFEFPALLADGADYLVAVRDAPLGHPCVIEHAAGAIQHAPAADVAVHCPSADATLDALTVSAGALSPRFDPATEKYAVSPLRVPSRIFPAAPVTTTVTAKAHDPGAIVSIAGVPTPSGAPSAAIALAPGPNPIDVAVTAPDRKTTTHYTIALFGRPNDYLKHSNTAQNEALGFSVAVSGDTLAIGAADGSQYRGDTSCATGVNPPPAADCVLPSGAVYIFVRSGGKWSQQAYIKASNTWAFAAFGLAVAISGDTLVVGAPGERSKATGINGDQTRDPVLDAGPTFCNYPSCAYGAAYVFTRTAGTWSQTAYLKASNTRVEQYFGGSVAISGNTIAVGAEGEDSGVAGNPSDTSAPAAGAVYIYTSQAGTWSEQAYLKASNVHTRSFFGNAVALDGDTLAVGAFLERSKAKGVNDVAHQLDFLPPDPANSFSGPGAVYTFRRSGVTWTQEAFIKAAAPLEPALFGNAIALAGDTLVAGAPGQPVAGAANGAVYVFTRGAGGWSEGSILTPPSTQGGLLFFGSALAISGSRLAVGARYDTSGARGLGGDPTDVSEPQAGGVYLFSKTGATWSRTTYVKASNTRTHALFGTSVGLTNDFLVVGAPGEGSGSKGINSDDTDLSAISAGAAYIF